MYFHQPLLCCSRCKDVYHGSCLKLNNEKIFILQQFSWHCNTCNEIERIDYTCETCFTKLDVSIDKITQCKQCFKILHKSCITSNVCLTCLPLPLLDLNYSNVDHINNDFYRNQPYFSPFEFYCNEVIDFVPDAELLSDNLQHCSEILRQCEYYTIDEYNILDVTKNFTFFGLNIDGFRTNFDTFLINHEKLSSDSSKIISGYFICETNVTEFESQRFYIPGYNKFVLDRLIKDDGNFKQKGSGLAIYLGT